MQLALDLEAVTEAAVAQGSDAAADDAEFWGFTDWLVREVAPAWLDLAGLADDAAALRSLCPVVSVVALTPAAAVLEPIHRRAEEARNDDEPKTFAGRQDVMRPVFNALSIAGVYSRKERIFSLTQRATRGRDLVRAATYYDMAPAWCDVYSPAFGIAFDAAILAVVRGLALDATAKSLVR